MKVRGFHIVLVCLLCVTTVSAQDPAAAVDSLARVRIAGLADSLLNSGWFREATGCRVVDSIRIDTVIIDRKKSEVRIVAGTELSWFPARAPEVDSLEHAMRSGAGESLRGFACSFYSDKRNLREYIPNYYRPDPRQLDRSRRLDRHGKKPAPLVQDLSRPYLREASLYGSHIALWPSHGWYYEPALHRWEWQRARIFQTVEDLYPMTFTLQFLVPMLENAGACVLLPRERDWQEQEVIVDNDGSTGRSIYVSGIPSAGDTAGKGFGLGNPPYRDENPFTLGTFQVMEASKKPTAVVQWIPEIPETGEYGIYVSYHASEDNADDALYRVHHAGGVTGFRVNQRMGGSTWIYLGRFRFEEGLNPGKGCVELSNESDRRKAVISADAVRFGGGKGIIERNGMTSLRPRYQEAARYYLQFAGFPDSLVWKLNDPEQDYKDDYQGRGEWVSYLMNPLSGKEGRPGTAGLGIPVDLSFAFHTDAGITDNDTVVGTLGIFSTSYRKGPFPSGLSRMTSRDLADLVQTQIVDDLRALYDPAWTRRALWDRPYSEAFRPNAPAMLLELLSHQNLLDMRFGQEPMFRFQVSRAIYKGMLRFMSSVYGTQYVVQPLPVTHFSTRIVADSSITLSWKPAEDPLEPTAVPDRYRVYTRVGRGGFDRGTDVEDPVWTLEEPVPDSVYSFRVTALNRGGEGFPSEVLSACIRTSSKGTVLIINAFDRTGGAAYFDDSAYSGFLPMVDQGVPWHEDLHTVGTQYDYRKDSPWLDDDSPGHGASYADLEATVIPGNSFDFSEVHGRSIAAAGYSFSSVSDESVIADSLDLAGYDVVDFLAGEERTCFFPKNDSVPLYQVITPPMMGKLTAYLRGGGNLFISGAHIASDIHFNGQDSVAAGLLKYRWRTSNASRTGKFYFTIPGFDRYTADYSFNTGIHPEIYTVEGADALEPADSTSITLARYRENNMSAAVAHRGDCGVVAMGFPFESITDHGARDAIMKKILDYFLKQDADE